MNKLITIVIPMYNVEQYLEKCLDSVVAQTYRNLQILCVDDGSTDATADILTRYAGKDPRIEVIRQENAKVSVARNSALKRAKGDYILFVDGDDWIDESTCEDALNTAMSENADVVLWSYIRELSDESREKWIFESDRVFEGEEVKKYLHRRMIGITGEELRYPENADALCTVWGKLYRSEIIQKNQIQFYDIREIGTYEDGLFNLDVFQYGKKAVFINKFYYHYRRDNTNSITSAYNKKLQGQWNKLFGIMEDYIRHNELDEVYHTALANRVVLSLIPLGINEMTKMGSSWEKIAGIKSIITAERYMNAIRSFRGKELPIYWKVFFGMAKVKCSLGIYLLLVVIQRIRGR